MAQQKSERGVKQAAPTYTLKSWHCIPWPSGTIAIAKHVDAEERQVPMAPVTAEHEPLCFFAICNHYKEWLLSEVIRSHQVISFADCS